MNAVPPTRIVLASASPRRRQLLAQLGVTFDVRPPNVNEDALPGETPLETQRRITRDKAAAIVSAELATDDSGLGTGGSALTMAVIACDTTVLLDGEMLNKPADAAEAWAMLRRLRGRTHQVQSCIVVAQGARVSEDVVVSEVAMRAYGDDEIAAYIASGDPYDKAGSYAVQHAQFKPVAEIRGCPLNVIGLSLCVLRERIDGLPECGPVCAAWFGVACPQMREERARHVTRGARLSDG